MNDPWKIIRQDHAHFNPENAQAGSVIHLLADADALLNAVRDAIHAIDQENDPDAPGRPWLVEHVLNILLKAEPCGPYERENDDRPGV